MLLDKEIFKCIVENAPLISIDFLIKKDNKYLLGKRKNPPAQDFYFTIGGRIFKNESIDDARKRILKEELNLDYNNSYVFKGIFEHFYDDSVFGKDISTHYINLVYEIEISQFKKLPYIQHIEYKWFDKEEILLSYQVHKYIKDCFIGSKYI